MGPDAARRPYRIAANRRVSAGWECHGRLRPSLPAHHRNTDI